MDDKKSKWANILPFKRSTKKAEEKAKMKETNSLKSLKNLISKIEEAKEPLDGFLLLTVTSTNQNAWISSETPSALEKLLAKTTSSFKDECLLGMREEIENLRKIIDAFEMEIEHPQ